MRYAPRWRQGGSDAEGDGESVDEARFVDVTDEGLPAVVRGGPSMHAVAFDADGDGDLDVLVAREFRQNVLLLGDGAGHFVDATERLPVAKHDSEDVVVHDFDDDGDLDAVFVAEDDRTDELYLNDGHGWFTAGTGLPAPGVSNGVAEGDVNGDGFVDLVIANNGQDAVWIGNGRAQFVDETATRAPVVRDVTQDLELADLDGDGDLDVVLANEGEDALWLNDGRGHFSLGVLPQHTADTETREVDVGDVDGDGDLDIAFGNTRLFMPHADAQDRLLLGDGRGGFVDVTAERLPVETDRTMEIDLVDLDADGDLDILTGNRKSSRGPAPFRAYANDGHGAFEDVTETWLPYTAVGSGFGIAVADFNGDGRLDLYFASKDESDLLLLARE